MKFMGVDPSTHTGLVIFDNETQETKGTVLEYPKLRGIPRATAIAREVQRRALRDKPEAVAIEGYSFNSQGSSISTQIEIGTLIRFILYEMGVRWYDVPPTTLKQLVTGSGSAKKLDMAEFVEVHWGYKNPSDDIIDAYCLARVAEDIYHDGICSEAKGVVLGW